MKITKTAAEETAKKMANDAMNQKIELAKAKLAEFIHLKVSERTPTELLPLFRDEKLNGYFRQESAFRISNNGKLDYYDYFYIDESFPVKDGNPRIDLEGEEYQNFVKLNKKLIHLEDAKRALISRINNAVFTMGTVKRLERDFPEAFEAMPEQFKTERVNTAIAIPVDDILKELKFYKL